MPRHCNHDVDVPRWTLRMKCVGDWLSISQLLNFQFCVFCPVGMYQMPGSNSTAAKFRQISRHFGSGQKEVMIGPNSPDMTPLAELRQASVTHKYCITSFAN